MPDGLTLSPDIKTPEPTPQIITPKDSSSSLEFHTSGLRNIIDSHVVDASVPNNSVMLKGLSLEEENAYKALVSAQDNPHYQELANLLLLLPKSTLEDSQTGAQNGQLSGQEESQVEDFDGLINQRAAEILLLNHRGLSSQLIGEVYGISPQAVNASLSKSRRKLSRSPLYQEYLVPKEKSILTPSQLEVLNLFAEGHREKQIAESLGKAPTTVKHFLEQARQRLGVFTTTEAVIKAINIREINPLGVIPEDFSISRINNLTKAERRDYDALVLSGESYAEVAYRLSVSEQTLKNRTIGLWKKLGLSGRSQAIIVHHAIQITELRFILSLEADAAGGSGGDLRQQKSPEIQKEPQSNKAA